MKKGFIICVDDQPTILESLMSQLKSANGCGITEGHLSRIWEPFFTTKNDEGTGLELDICKRIVEEHDGTITCTSQVDVGTTFTISLPVIRDA